MNNVNDFGHVLANRYLQNGTQLSSIHPISQWNIAEIIKPDFYNCYQAEWFIQRWLSADAEMSIKTEKEKYAPPFKVWILAFCPKVHFINQFSI